MIELKATTPFAGRLPISAGVMCLTEVDPGALTMLTPRRGAEAALTDLLQAAHNVAWPDPGRATGREGARALWFGWDQVLLMGPDPDAALSGLASVVDQTDGWAVARLDGRGASDALARLVPLDLRAGVFGQGHTARTELAHMHGSLTRIGDEAWQIMVFRSLARTLAHELGEAMRAVAARAGV